MSEQLCVSVGAHFVVFFDSDVVVDVQVFDPENLSQRGHTIIDFDTLLLTVPNFKDFLRVDGKVYEWMSLGLEYVGG